LTVPGREPVELAARDAALLAWLALEGPTPRARLAQLLWSDSEAEAARNAMRQRLFQLKRQCGAALVEGGAVLALADGVDHDLADADEVLADLGVTIGPEFDTWLAQQRERRRSRLHASLAELAELAEQACDWPDALGHARELLALEPHSEAAHRRLMRLHYLAGDRAAALLAFDACERMLKHEVGARPSAETLALLATIEQAEAAASPRDATLVVPTRVPAAVQRPPRLVGRDRERSALHDGWQHGRRVVVSGDGGLGKTRLVADFAAGHGAVLLASARPGDAGMLYASLSRLLRALPPGRLAQLPSALRTELARLLPELGRAAPLAGAADRTRFHNAVVAALDHEALALAGVVVDDLHFADAASVELLQYAADTTRCGWIVTARGAELGGPARRWLDAWRESPDAVSIDLRPLTLAQVEELVDSLGIRGLDGRASAPALLRHTGGNPLFILETLKVWLVQGGGGPLAGTTRLPAVANVGALIERRIGQLSAQAVALARCAAVAAPDFSIELAARVLGLRTLELADPWAELEAAQVLQDGAFVHDLIYEAALASVPRPVARRLHAEVAECLSEQGHEPARLAEHWFQAQRWPAAARAYEAAAQRALDAGRASDACDWLARAAECHDRCGAGDARFEALQQRAALLATQDLGAEARAAASALRDAARTAAQRLAALQVEVDLATNRLEPAAVLAVAPVAVEAARAQGRADLEMRFRIAWSGALLDERRVAEALAVLAPQTEAAASIAEPSLRWEHAMACALALDYAGRMREAASAYRDAEGVARAAGRNDWLWQSLANGAGTLGRLGRAAACCAALEAALVLARSLGSVDGMRLQQSESSLAHRLRDAGRYARSLDLLEAQRAAFSAEGMRADAALNESRLALLYVWLGQPGRAHALLATDPEGLPAGIAMFRRIVQAEVAARLGQGDGVGAMRAALAMLPNRDDTYHRTATLFLAARLPADEGEALAAGLASWASRCERHGLALAAHVRAAACAAAQRAWARAAVHVEAIEAFDADVAPDNLYPGERWLVTAQVLRGCGRMAEAAASARAGRDWLVARHDADVPEAFRASFLERNPVNRDLLALVALTPS
jgi:DNA-binding SARP family transcriptional activator